MDANGWIVEGSDEVIDLDRLRSLSQSGELTGRNVLPQGSDVALSPDELASLLGPIAPPVSAVNTPPMMAQYPRPGEAPVSPNDDPMRFVIPLNPSVWAVAAGYLGLFSVLCLPGPLSIFAGVMGLREIKKDPSKTGRGRAIFGIVAGSIGTGVMLFFLIAAMLGK